MKYSVIIKWVCLVLITLCTPAFINAQTTTQVTGKIVDSTNSKELNAITISFQKMGSKAAKTILSKEDGSFDVALDTGRYRINFTHSSYKPKGMTVNVTTEKLDLGTIIVAPDFKNLQGVNVNVKKPLVEQQADKLIYNVEDDPAAKTESASDILRKTPLVTVDGDGNVQVNGQANFKVLLNGKETALFAQNVKEALKGFPGAIISKIEVITSPSAKYDAEGVGGLINIITKKKVVGYNGNISGYYNPVGISNGSVNLNLKTGKLGLTGFYSVNGSNNLKGTSTSETIPFSSSIFNRRYITGERFNDHFYNFGNLEASYDVDSTNTVSVYGNLSGGRNSANFEQLITTEYQNGSTISPFIQNTRNEYPTFSFGSDFIRKYKKQPEKELSFRFNGQFSKNSGYNASEQGSNGTQRFVINNTKSLNREYTVQVDLIQPLKNKTRLETGVKGILRRATSDFQSMSKSNAADNYKIDATNSDYFKYNQNVYSLYTSLNKTFKKFSGRAGVRLEGTDIDGDFVSSNKNVRQSYVNVIPNLQVTKKFSPMYTVVASYSMRLQRPFITSLNPFVNNNDALNIFFGNPDLGPQHMHSFSFQNRIFKGMKFFSATLGYNFSNNAIMQYPTFYPATGVTATTSDNIGKMSDVNLTLVANAPLTAKFNVGINGNLRYVRSENKKNAAESRSGFGGNMHGNFAYKVTKLFTISGSGGFFRMPRSLYNSFPVNYFYQVNFGHKFFKEKLSATINFNNFHSKYRTFESSSENAIFRTRNSHENLFRAVFAGVTYNFGKLKENVSKKKGVTNDDLIQ